MHIFMYTNIHIFTYMYIQVSYMGDSDEDDDGYDDTNMKKNYDGNNDDDDDEEEEEPLIPLDINIEIDVLKMRYVY
jgi:hypothetical protein